MAQYHFCDANSKVRPHGAGINYTTSLGRGRARCPGTDVERGLPPGDSGSGPSTWAINDRWFVNAWLVSIGHRYRCIPPWAPSTLSIDPGGLHVRRRLPLLMIKRGWCLAMTTKHSPSGPALFAAFSACHVTPTVIWSAIASHEPLFHCILLRR